MQKTSRAHIPLSLVFLAFTQDMGIKVDFNSSNSIWFKCGIFKKVKKKKKKEDTNKNNQTNKHTKTKKQKLKTKN